MRERHNKSLVFFLIIQFKSLVFLDNLWYCNLILTVKYVRNHYGKNVIMEHANYVNLKIAKLLGAILRLQGFRKSVIAANFNKQNPTEFMRLNKVTMKNKIVP